MEARKELLTNIIQGKCQFIIPVFQRNFSWTVEQCEQLWLDVMRASSAGAASEHFMGSIVYIGAGGSGAGFQRWLLIDGQQRLTTLTLLLIALRDHIRESVWAGGEDDPTTEKIDDYYLKNSLEQGDRHHKLMLRRKDNDTLQALVAGNDLAELEEHCSGLLIGAYKYFRSELKTCDPGDVYRGITSLNIVDVTLDRGVDNPQLVFESMNSTGVDLRPSDLIRNYLLMDMDEENQTRIYNDYWYKIESCFSSSDNAFDSFLRDYMALEQGSTNPIRLDRVYDEFKIFRSQDSERPLQDLLAAMMRMARTYASFRGVERMQDRYQWLDGPMSAMRSLGTTQGVLVMRLYDCHAKGRLTDDEFERAVGLIESYLLRRAVLGWQTRGYWSVFARIAHDLNRESDESVFESLQVAFARLGGNYRFPGDEEFRKDIKEHDLYGLRVCKHILDRLENAGQGEPSPVHDYSIEHIMPQQISNVPEWQNMLGEDWETCHATHLHRLGNLTLTAYNSTYSNRPFHEKQDIEGGFRKSAVRLNLDVRDQTRWTAEEIESRGNTLADRALGIWPNHAADAASVQAEHVRELEERAAQQNVGDLDMDDVARELLDGILALVREFTDVIEVVENRSVCCYGPESEFFAELVPMTQWVRIILPLEFGEVANQDGLTVRDASAWKFVPNRVHTDCNLLVDVLEMENIPLAASIIHQALEHGR